MSRSSILLAAAVAVSWPATAAATTNYVYYKLAIKISQHKGNGVYNCLNKTRCVAVDGAALAYQLKTAFRVPASWSVGPPVLEGGAGGAAVTFAPAPCAAGSCEIDALHPAPPGQKWVQFVSTEIMGASGSAEADLELHYRFTVPAGESTAGRTVANWLSNDGDERYGWTVTDLHEEYVVDETLVPALFPIGVWALAGSLGVLGAAALGLAGRRRSGPAGRRVDRELPE